METLIALWKNGHGWWKKIKYFSITLYHIYVKVNHIVGSFTEHCHAISISEVLSKIELG